ncbi:MAG: zinc-binding dehydrogenase [Candidatus Limnocylindrales bacterium]
MAQPEVRPSEVLVRVRSCGICGSDVHGVDGSTGRRIPPVIMGHEASGDVVAIGSEVDGWREGDRITFDSTVYCGSCRFCERGLVNLCDNRRVLGVSCAEYRQNGAFAEFVAVPARLLYRLPAGVSYAQAALVEPLSVAAHAYARASVEADTSVVVVGCGIVGLLIIQLLRARGVANVIGVDVDPYRLDRAAGMGAKSTFNSATDDVLGSVREVTNGCGADVVYEAVGIAATFKLGVDLLDKNGTIVLIGNLADSVNLPLQWVVTRQLTLAGSAASSGEYPESIDLIARHSVDVDSLISAAAPLSEGSAWFRRLGTNTEHLLKVVLEP